MQIQYISRHLCLYSRQITVKDFVAGAVMRRPLMVVKLDHCHANEARNQGMGRSLMKEQHSAAIYPGLVFHCHNNVCMIYL